MCMEMVSNLKKDRMEWNLYTDDSKSGHGSSFTVVDEFGNTKIKGLLANSTYFTADAFAILKATMFANNKTIFSDSLSTITALKNLNNETAIIDRLGCIPENEMADKADEKHP